MIISVGVVGVVIMSFSIHIGTPPQCMLVYTYMWVVGVVIMPLLSIPHLRMLYIRVWVVGVVIMS